MKIKTINPVTIDGKRISKPSKYLSADGDDDDYYGFDANGKPTNSAETKMFQKWLVAKGVDISFTTKATATKPSKTYSGAEAIDGDMRAGSKTAKAWDTYGAEFTASMKSLGNTLGNLFESGATTSTETTTTPTVEPTKEEKIEQAKKGVIWDKVKGWVKSDKAKDVLKSLLAGEGFMGFLNTLLGGGSGAGTTTDGTTTTTTDTTQTGMSKGAKIGIAVGIVAVLGIVIYVATRPKK